MVGNFAHLKAEGVRLPRLWDPETAADLWGGSGNFRKVGELPGKPGKLLGNLWIALKIHSERSSGEVAEDRGSSGKVLGSPGTFQKRGGA